MRSKLWFAPIIVLLAFGATLPGLVTSGDAAPVDRPYVPLAERAVVPAAPGGDSALTIDEPDAPAQAPYVLQASRLAWISTADREASHASQTGVWVGYGPGPDAPDCCQSLRGLVSFSVLDIPVDADVVDVELRATVSDSHGEGAFRYNVARLDGGWSADTASWADQPPRYGRVAHSSVSATATQVSWTSEDLRATVQGWVDGTTPNHGLMIRRMDDTTDETIHDRRFRDMELVVEVSVDAAPTTMPPRISKVDLRDPVAPGLFVEYIIEPRAELRGTGIIEVVDTMPEGTTFASASDGGVHDGNRTVTWTIPGSIYSGELSLTVQVPSSAPDGSQLENHVALIVDGETVAQDTEITMVQVPTPTATQENDPIIIIYPEWATRTPTPTPTPLGPPPTGCTELVRNGDFETGDLSYWRHVGEPAELDPSVTQGTAHGDRYSALLGPRSSADMRGTSSITRFARIPSNAQNAALRFWYSVATEEYSAENDWLVVTVAEAGSAHAFQVLRVGSDTDWTEASQDLVPFAGSVVQFTFSVYNDGQQGSTQAFIDDVSLCVDAGDKHLSLPKDQPGACWAPDLVDYAPHGMPDFSQHQEGWTVPATGAPSHDGPVAVANALWWVDSRFEHGDPPPAVSNGFGLVSPYSTGDDHAAENVRPLVADLAGRMGTNGEQPGGVPHLGTDASDLVGGIRSYLGERGMLQEMDVDAQRMPSFEWVRTGVRRNDGVVLLLGFWELQPGGWRRLGGHYVAVSGAGCQAEWIAFSDPYRDGAEEGVPGRFEPPVDHEHPTYVIHDPLEGVDDPTHNDAAFVSHDAYLLTHSSLGWGPANYAEIVRQIAPFVGMNDGLEPPVARAQGYNRGTIITVVDFGVRVAPIADQATLRLSPPVARLAAGQTFEMRLIADSGPDGADLVNAHLDFDHTVLTVIGDDGMPASALEPGTALSEVTTNSVDNASGAIDFVARGPTPVRGAIPLATVRFRAQQPVMQTLISFATEGERNSQVFWAGQPMLTDLRPAIAAVGPGALLSGSVDLQGRAVPPHATWRTPLLVQLDMPAKRTSPPYVYGVMTDEEGNWSLPVTVKPAHYNVRAKSFHTLRNVRPVVEVPAGTTSVDLSELLEGDANNDNHVDAADVSQFSAAFGTSLGEAGYDVRSDFNADGVIDDSDQGLMHANIGRVGDVVVDDEGGGDDVLAKPERGLEELARLLGVDDVSGQSHSYFSTGRIAGSAQAGSVTLRLSPAKQTAVGTDSFTLEVLVDAGEESVDTVAAHVNYDPARLRVVGASGEPVAAVELGTALPAVYMNRVSQGQGRIDVVSSAVGSEARSGRFLLATIRFKPLMPDRTDVRFAFEPGRMTDALRAGMTVLGPVEAAQIYVQEGSRVYLPLGEVSR